VLVPPIYWVTLAVIAGDALGNLRVGIPLWVAFLLSLGALAMMVAARPGSGVALALLGITAVASVPAYRLLTASLSPAGVTSLADGSIVAIEGEVVAVPEHLFGWRTRLVVSVKRAGESEGGFGPSSGLIRVTAVGKDENFREGDDVFVRARLFFPRNFGNPGQFDYRAYLERHGIAATMFVPARPYAGAAIRVIGYHPHFPSSEFEAIRNRIGAFIDANLRGTERAMMRALVIGDRGGIGERLRSRFALTGMAHLLVISGLHLGFVAAAVFVLVRLLLGFFPALLARGWGNKMAAFAAALAVSAYASIAGHHVSTDRALVMVLSYTIAIMIDRSREVLASLALAALAICLVLPGSTADISFQLSFASVLVIILGMRRFTAWWKARLRPLRAVKGAGRIGLIGAEVLAGYFAVSFWALLATAPLTAYYFNQFGQRRCGANRGLWRNGMRPDRSGAELHLDPGCRNDPETGGRDGGGRLVACRMVSPMAVCMGSGLHADDP
jgi:competence protein ComEC